MKHFHHFFPRWQLIKNHIENANPFWKNSLIHGEKHTERCIWAASNLMEFFYSQLPNSRTPESILIPVAFHDAGRKGEGTDLWEMDSYRMCLAYLLNSGVSKVEAQYSATAILKNPPLTRNAAILYDADVLEYSRFIHASDFDYSRLQLPGSLKLTPQQKAHFFEFCQHLIVQLNAMQDQEIAAQINRQNSP